VKILLRILKWTGIILLLLLTAAVVFLCTYGSAPAKRPDLVTKLPAGVPPPPEGYPGEILAFAAGYLFYDLIPIEDGPPVPGVLMREDLQFGTGEDTPLFLDLYSPEDQEEALPGILLFFGGSWKHGRKDQLRVYAQYLAARGYVVAAVQYRLRSAGQWPNSIHDAKCAVRWMRAHQEEYGIDGEHLGVMGNSAGGYLALMVGYTSGQDDFEGRGGWAEQDSAVQAVVDIYGPVDFTEEIRRDHSAIISYMGGKYEEMPERFEKASPLWQLHKTAPPTCVIHGTVDQLVPVTQSDRLVERLAALEIPHDYSRIDGWPHAMDVALPVCAHVQALAGNFFDRHLKAGK
jgi:acetyl esterase/lipase